MDQQPRKGPAAMARGQTSLDFLMTYGWAISLVAIVIGALFALGIFNVGSFLGPRTTGFSQVSVIAWNINSAGDFSLKLQNFAGKGIRVAVITVTRGTSSISYNITNVSIPDGKVSNTFTVGTISGLAPGQYYTLPLRIIYADLNGFNYTDTGTISGTVGTGAVPPSVRINSPSSNSLLTSRTIGIGVTVAGANLSYTDISIINYTSGDVVNSTSNSSTGTYTVQLSVPDDGAYNITAVAHYTGGSNRSAVARNVTVNTTAPPALQCGDPLSTPNHVYTLSGDVNSSGTCFTIAADNVMLDCDGHSINYSQSVDGYGVNVTGYDNAVITNCTFYNDRTEAGASIYAISLLDSSNSRILYNILSHTTSAISLEQAYNSTVAHNNMVESLNWGVVLYNTSDNNITLNTISASVAGLAVIEGAHESITDNDITALSPNNQLIYVSSSNDSVIHGNRISGSVESPLFSVEGIYLTDSNGINVTGNSVNGSEASAVQTNNVTRSLFSGNSIDTVGPSAYGIRLSIGSGNNASDNRISTNGSSAFGTSLESDSGSSIADNNITVYGDDSYGVYVAASENDSVSGNDIGVYGAGVETAGVYVLDSDNIIIRDNSAYLLTESMNMRIIKVYNSNNSAVERNYAYSSINGAQGLDIEFAVGTNLTNNTVVLPNGGSIGIELFNSNESAITGNTVDAAGGSTYAAFIETESSRNNLSDNVLTASGADAVAIGFYGAANDNLLYNNIINGTTPVSSDGSPNLWNTTLDCGTTNIIGGNCTGGNFWAQPDGNGWSQNATECNANSNGICTSNYTMDSNNIDYLPLTNLAPRSAVDDTVWVANFGSDTVSRINKTTGGVIGSPIGVGSYPYGIAVDQDSVWVANYNDGAVSRINKTTGGVIGSPIGAGSGPTGIAVDQDSVWVANMYSSTVSRINKTTNTNMVNITVGSGPQSIGKGIAVDRDSVWVANYNDGTVSRINKTTDTVIANITGFSGPQGIAVDWDSVWVSNNGGSTVSRINKSTNTNMINITVGSSPYGVAVDQDSVWVANQDSNTVSRINKTTETVIGSQIGVGTIPYGISIDQDSVWVSNYNDNTVSRINRTTGTVIGSPIAVGANPVNLGDMTGYAYDMFFR